MVRGRPTHGAAYASGIRHPPHHLTPTLLMNVKFLAEVYLSRIQEHGNKVKKTRARTHKASMGHTFKSTKTSFLYSKVRLQQMLIYYMGFEAQISYRLPSPLRLFSGVELGDGRDVCFELPSKDGS